MRRQVACSLRPTNVRRVTTVIPTAPSSPVSYYKPIANDEAAPAYYKIGAGPSIPVGSYKNPFTSVLPPADLDFCFHVTLSEIPPPPTTAFTAKKEAVLESFADQNANTFSIQNFVSTIPSFFVPVEEVLKVLEGYTMEHIDNYFGRTRSVQIVPVGGTKFMRIFGGYTKMDMTDTYEAAGNFPQYVIDPSAADPYVAVFGGRYQTWMPLRMLIERGGPKAEAALPFKGPKSLLYFAQMQHIFAFAPDNGGAVQLRDPLWSELDIESSPCPAAVAFLMDSIVEDQYEAGAMLDAIPDGHKADMLKFFPSLEACVKKHGRIFHLDLETGMLMKTRTKQRLEAKKLPLEQQLELAIFSKDKKKMRMLRRKIQVRNNPNNPLLERDNLAREVFNYIPKKGFITMTMLARRALPPEMLDFMGNDHVKFYKLYPQHFQIFELHEATKWCVARAGVDLPQGVLRTEYSEEEILRIVAATIQRRGSMPCVRLTLYLPDGARDYIKKTYTSPYYFCLKFPKYFSLMRRSETENAELSSVVSLLAMPVEGATTHRERSAGGPAGGDEDEDDFLD